LQRDQSQLHQLDPLATPLEKLSNEGIGCERLTKQDFAARKSTANLTAEGLRNAFRATAAVHDPPQQRYRNFRGLCFDRMVAMDIKQLKV
jgi:hypothetical protein